MGRWGGGGVGCLQLETGSGKAEVGLALVLKSLCFFVKRAASLFL